MLRVPMTGRRGTLQRFRAAPRCSARAGRGLLVLLLAAGLPAAADGPWRATEANTPGWAAMTPAERVDYQRAMRALESLEACRTFQAEHRAHVRARERSRQRLRGQPAPPDAEALCLQLRQAGQFR